MNIDYTLWPNADGELGKNKVTIPDGVTVQWPEGDALVGNFVYKDGLLSGFVDTKALTVNESKSTVINYDYFDIELPFTEGEIAITRGERSKYFNVRYNPINDDNAVITLKYKGCKTVADVTAVDANYLTTDIVDGVWSEGLGDLENGDMMFAFSENLASFSSDLSSLTNGSNMFAYCENLSEFYADLPNLTNGSCMFNGCNKLTAFTSDLSSLTAGNNMFIGCSDITTFTSDLSSLTAGSSMFFHCSNLTTFTSDLSSLTNGWYMFRNCKLDIVSVKNIAETIKTVSNSPSIDIGIGNTSPTAEENTYFTQIHNKGWQVYVNGSSSAYAPATATTDETGETQEAPIPFWAKPVPATEEDAQYVDADGNFYNILGGQFIFVDDPETYGMFTCEEDAAANMRLTKYVKPVEKA